MGGFLAWLLLYRLARRRGEVSVPRLVALALLICAATAASEALYYHLKSGADLVRVLSANLSLDTGTRPSWLVGGAGMALALLGLARSLWSGGVGYRARTSAPARY
jgi:hypothetical protein